MDGEGQGIESAEQRGSGGVEVLIPNAVDTRSTSGASSPPVAIGNDFIQRHAVAGSAPGRDQDIRIHAGNLIEGNPLPRLVMRSAACPIPRRRPSDEGMPQYGRGRGRFVFAYWRLWPRRHRW